jgi:hypothetical protein
MSQIAKYVLAGLAALFIVAWQGAALATSLAPLQRVDRPALSAYHHVHSIDSPRKG